MKLRSRLVPLALMGSLVSGCADGTGEVDDKTIDTVAPGVSDSSIPDQSPNTSTMDDTSSTTTGWFGARRRVGPGSSESGPVPRSPPVSLAGLTVHMFAYEVGVSVVAGVLLDHVDEHPSKAR